eukprot:147703-Prorocentrum_lima.AAC.1
MRPVGSRREGREERGKAGTSERRGAGRQEGGGKGRGEKQGSPTRGLERIPRVPYERRWQQRLLPASAPRL